MSKRQSLLRVVGCIIFLLISQQMILFAQTRFENKISGRITNAETGESLVNVNVFLANTTRGDATDKEGYYLIENIPPGAYELVFSMIGFELEIVSVQMFGTKSVERHKKLRPRILKGKEVEVVSSIPKDWKKNLQKFTTAFIGDSKNADQCRLINPEVLDFHVDNKANYFIATTDSILIVENRALGYRIHTILDTFRLSEDSLIYATYPRYEELTPEHEKQRKNWLENRNRTYHGSFRHFLAALFQDKLEQEGFYVFDLRGNRLKKGFFSFVPDTNLAMKWLYFYEPVEVVYKGVYHAGEGKYFPRWGSRFPSSYLYLKKGYALIDTSGNVYTRFAFIHSGYWFNERTADNLPFDYTPDRQDKN